MESNNKEAKVYIKDFDKWNLLKRDLHDSDIHKTFHEREIFWCNIGVNIGDEEDGKNDNFERPVLILKKFSKNLLKIIPLSTKIKEGKYYINFENDDFKYSVLLSQSKTISSKRLIRYMSRMSEDKFGKVKEGYKSLLNL